MITKYQPEIRELPKLMQRAIDKTGINLADIARRTGINKENIYKWYRGTKPSDSLTCGKLIKFLNDLIETFDASSQDDLAAVHSLMDVNGSNFVTKRELSYFITVPLKNEGQPTPLLTPKGGAGTVLFEQDGPKLIVHRIDAPFLSEIIGMVNVPGNSMEPTFKNGSYIGIVMLKDLASLEWGECYYILDSNFQGMVKRIYAGEQENTIVLTADHPEQKYPPITKTFTQIEAIFKIKAYLLTI
jgi:hypothetical protein